MVCKDGKVDNKKNYVVVDAVIDDDYYIEGAGEDVANAVSFLASTEASYITGVELNVDGGAGQL